MPLQIAVGAYFVLFLPSEVSKMGYLFLQHTQMIYVNFCWEADSLVDSGGRVKRV